MHGEAHVLIHHPAPLTEERAVEAWTYLDLSYGSGWEKLYVAPAGDGLWRLCNLPHQVYGLKVGSLVAVDRNGRIARRLSNPAEPAYRLKLARVSDRDACLAALGECWVEPMHTVFVGVQPFEGECVEAFHLALGRLVENGIVEDVEDVCGSPFDPGPSSSGNAAPGPGPGVYDPTG